MSDSPTGPIAWLRSKVKNVPSQRTLGSIEHELLHLRRQSADDYVLRHVQGNPRYAESKRLARHEYQVHSQAGEDGAIREIFRRIGEGARRFVEIGVGDGLQNNTTYCLIRGWEGAWLEASSERIAVIRARFAPWVDRGALRVEQAMIDAENIESLLEKVATPADLDLLSIDIDGNDYWIWKALERVRPRVIVIEYNAAFRPGDRWVIPYERSRVWDRTSAFGSSLESLATLGREKGYSLVGCSFAGLNAYFVRDDEVGDHFEAPFTTENHHEPPRYFLAIDFGHRRGVAEGLPL